MGCKSCAFCGDACYLKGKSIASSAPSNYNKYCTTFRKDAGTDDMCFNLFSSMAFNNLLQSFPNNPDSHAEGMATFKLGTNGTLIADTALVYGGQTPLIASHIHRASNDDGENGSGPPVISFLWEQHAWPDQCSWSLPRTLCAVHGRLFEQCEHDRGISSLVRTKVPACPSGCLILPPTQASTTSISTRLQAGRIGLRRIQSTLSQ